MQVRRSRVPVAVLAVCAAVAASGVVPSAAQAVKPKEAKRAGFVSGQPPEHRFPEGAPRTCRDPRRRASRSGRLAAAGARQRRRRLDRSAHLDRTRSRPGRRLPHRPAKARARDIALGYVRANRRRFRSRRVCARRADAAPGLRRRRRDAPPLLGPAGQRASRSSATGSSAHVTKDGRLVAFTGSPSPASPGFPGAPGDQRRGRARDGRQGRRRHGLAPSAPRSCPAPPRTPGSPAATARAWCGSRPLGAPASPGRPRSPPPPRSSTPRRGRGPSGRVLYRSSLVDNDTAVVWEHPGPARSGAAPRGR